MKTLFLPFVVVALFAIGSCGDDASINLPVDKKDTTKNQDTIRPFKIIALQFVKVDSLRYYTSILEPGEPLRYSWAMFQYEFLKGVYPVTITNTDSAYQYTWSQPSQLCGSAPYSLEFNINTYTKKIQDLKFGFNVSCGPSSAFSFTLHPIDFILSSDQLIIKIDQVKNPDALKKIYKDFYVSRPNGMQRYDTWHTKYEKHPTEPDRFHSIEFIFEIE